MTETASASQSTRVRRRIGELLVDDGVLTAEQLQEARRSAKVIDGRRERLGQTIARLGFTSALVAAKNASGREVREHGLSIAGVDSLRAAVDRALIAPPGGGAPPPSSNAASAARKVVLPDQDDFGDDQ